MVLNLDSTNTYGLPQCTIVLENGQRCTQPIYDGSKKCYYHKSKEPQNHKAGKQKGIIDSYSG